MISCSCGMEFDGDNLPTGCIVALKMDGFKKNEVRCNRNCGNKYPPKRKENFMNYEEFLEELIDSIDKRVNFMTDKFYKNMDNDYWLGRLEETKQIKALINSVKSITDQRQESMDQSYLGRATNAQLIDELKARIEIHGNLDYKPTNNSSFCM